MLFGAHVSSAGGIDKAVERAAELGCDCAPGVPAEPAHVAAAPPPRRTRPLPRAGRGGRSAAPSPRDLPDQPRRTDRARPSSVGGASLAQAAAHGARRSAPTGRDRPPRLAPRRGFEAGSSSSVPALERVLELAARRTWLLLENTAGRGRHDGPHVDELARSSTRSTSTRGSASASTAATCSRSGVDVRDPRRARRAARRARRAIGLDRLARCTSTTRDGARLQPRPPRQHRRRAIGGGHRGLPRAPAPAGPAGGARDAAGTRARARDAQCMRELGRLWRLGLGGLTCASRSSIRRPSPPLRRRAVPRARPRRAPRSSS